MATTGVDRCEVCAGPLTLAGEKATGSHLTCEAKRQGIPLTPTTPPDHGAWPPRDYGWKYLDGQWVEYGPEEHPTRGIVTMRAYSFRYHRAEYLVCLKGHTGTDVATNRCMCSGPYLPESALRPASPPTPPAES